MKISAKTKNHEAVSAEANIPSTLEEKVALFGEDVVNGAAEDSLIITVQALMRRMMTEKVDKDGKVTSPEASPEEIQAAVANWRPDVRTMVRQTAFEKAASSVEKLSPEERKALLAKLQALK